VCWGGQSLQIFCPPVAGTFPGRGPGNNYAVRFLNSYQGLVTRDGGGALFTTDGGITWNESSTPDTVRKQLRHTFALSEEAVWTVGSDGNVVKSTTRGDVWFHLNYADPVLNRNGQAASLYDIWMFDQFNGICVGEEGTLAATDDGGVTWASIALPTTFFDITNGSSILNEPGDIYRIHFFDSDNGIVSADNGRILLTDDGGVSWTLGNLSSHYCGAAGAAGDLELWSMSFDGNEGWLVGGNGTNNGHVFHTTTAGASWAHVDYAVPIDPIVEALWISGTGGWQTFYGVAALGNGKAVFSAPATRTRTTWSALPCPRSRRVRTGLHSGRTICCFGPTIRATRGLPTRPRTRS